MKPRPFVYHGPVADALTILASHGDTAKVLAGGQSLIPLISMPLSSPESLVDINAIEEFDFVTVDDARGVRVGTCVRQGTLEGDACALVRVRCWEKP